MNALGDDHVSFSAAHLAASACGRLLLVSGDNGRLVVYETAGTLNWQLQVVRWRCLFLGHWQTGAAGVWRQPCTELQD